jgi:hypothetical protein
MFKRFFIIFVILFSASIVNAQTSPTNNPDAVDVEVKNTPNVNVVNKLKIENFESPPEVPVPTIPEDVSTIEAMIQPLFTWRDSFVQSINVPHVTGQCPTSTMYMFGKVLHLDAHCKVFSDVAPLLAPACLLFYACFAGLIILRA